MDGGPETIGSTDEQAQLRRQARRVHIDALALATALVTIVAALPTAPDRSTPQLEGGRRNAP